MIKTTPYFLGANTISQTNTTNKVQDTNISNQGKSNKKQYNDPLNQWPVRGLAYSNEIGAAISEIAPKAGLLLWIPALLYFGADIYDKYKNDKNSYDPSAKRGTKQAIFQLLASVILPTAAVKVGQKTASVMGLMGKDKLSLQTQEELHRFTINYIKQKEPAARDWEAGSALLGVWLFAKNHFQLYNIDPDLSLAFGTVERKFYQYCVLIHLCPSLTATDRASNPS